MRILSAHNEYQIRGGEDESCESEERLLREMGHQVDSFRENNQRIQFLSNLDLSLKTVWSRETFKNATYQIKEKKYDVVHVQNFFPLISPSIYYAAKEQGVPVVQTLRNYRLLCPNGLFFRDGKVCESCADKFIPYPGFIHSCYRENRAASGVVASMLVFHRILKTWTQMIDKYITLTHFARKKFIETGFPEHKIVVKPNFVNPDPGIGQGSGNYALFVGRLSVEKGLDTLLEAWSDLQTPIPLKIIGDGPLNHLVQNASKKFSNIEWLGRRPINEVYDLMGEAMFLIFPSKWYETFGRVAVESFAKGTPVIGSNIGAISELIDDGRTGFLFQTDKSDDLAAKVELALSNSQKLLSMRQEVRVEFESKYTKDSNYEQLMEIYTQINKK